MGTVPDKNLSQEYRSISNNKPTSLTTIGWYLELTCGPEACALYNGIMTRHYFSVFLYCEIFMHENKIISNTKICDINPTVKVIFSRYRTYLLTWCRTITNHHPVLFWIAYFTKRKPRYAYTYRWDKPNQPSIAFCGLLIVSSLLP